MRLNTMEPLFRRFNDVRSSLRPRMSWRDVWPMLRETYKEWDAAKAQRMGAALAFYAIISMAPLLVLVLGVVALVFGEKAAAGGLVHEIKGTLGEPVARAVEDMVANAHNEQASGWLATIAGAVVLLFGASGVFAELQDALNTIWQVAPKPGRGVLNFIRTRFLSVVLVLGTAFLLLASLVVSSAITALSKLWTPAGLPGGAWLWHGVNALVAFGVITVMFAMIFKILPDAKVRWGEVWVAAAGTALLFNLGKYLLALYVVYASPANGYGAAGSLVVVLVWIYYSAQILLFGVTFSRVYTQRFGGGIKPTPDAVPLTPQDLAKQGINPNEVTPAAGGPEAGHPQDASVRV
jgi:membrane protein